MRIKRIEHVGIVVADLGASRVFWEDCLGLRCEAVEELAQYQVRLAMYPVGQSMVELLTSTIRTTYPQHEWDRFEGHFPCLPVRGFSR